MCRILTCPSSIIMWNDPFNIRAPSIVLYFPENWKHFCWKDVVAVIQFKHAKKKVKFWLIVEKLLFSVDNYFRGSSKTLSKIKQRKKFFILISTELVTYYVVGSRQYRGRGSWKYYGNNMSYILLNRLEAFSGMNILHSFSNRLDVLIGPDTNFRVSGYGVCSVREFQYIWSFLGSNLLEN